MALHPLAHSPRLHQCQVGQLVMMAYQLAGRFRTIKHNSEECLIFRTYNSIWCYTCDFFGYVQRKHKIMGCATPTKFCCLSQLLDLDVVTPLCHSFSIYCHTGFCSLCGICAVFLGCDVVIHPWPTIGHLPNRLSRHTNSMDINATHHT